MAKMNLLQAINNALITAMTEDEKVMALVKTLAILVACSVQPVTFKKNFARRVALTRRLLNKALSASQTDWHHRALYLLLKFNSVITFFLRSIKL